MPMNEYFQPRRELGRTGWKATVLGIGDLADRSLPLEELVKTARRALDAGLNIMDTAPGYEEGYSEEIVGRAVEGRRERVFVITKIDHPDQPVMPQIKGSLGRMNLPAADAFVFHGVSSLEAWKEIIAPGGAMEELEDGLKRGLSRFRGISSHHPEVLREAIGSGRCDLVMFPVGPFCDPRYIAEILPQARREKIGTVCFKTFGAGKLLGDSEGYGRPLQEPPNGKLVSGGPKEMDAPLLPRLTVEECVRYTLTCDPDVALLGLSFPKEQDAAFAAARGFVPYQAHEMEEIRRRASLAVQGKGRCWWNPR